MSANDDKTLRDEFAMAALTGVLSVPQSYTTFTKHNPSDPCGAAATLAYGIADAMMAERKK